MAGHPYVYEVAYEPDIAHALQSLRQREFEAGRYNPVMPFPQSPFGEEPSDARPRHKTIAAALAAAGTDGTRSILDIDGVASEPDYSVAAPLPADVLEELADSPRPSSFFARLALHSVIPWLERGHCIYIICYENEQPTSILFAGLSYD